MAASVAEARGEPLWSGQICPDHPHYRRNSMPERENWDCKNCWRILLGYPARMYSDHFPAAGQEQQLVQAAHLPSSDLAQP